MSKQVMLAGNLVKELDSIRLMRHCSYTKAIRYLVKGDQNMLDFITSQVEGVRYTVQETYSEDEKILNLLSKLLHAEALLKAAIKKKEVSLDGIEG